VVLVIVIVTSKEVNRMDGSDGVSRSLKLEVNPVRSLFSFLCDW
jgi:hypothetical protein